MKHAALTLLHIDDDSATVLLLRDLLSESDPSSGRIRVNFLAAASVEEAVRRFASERPAAVLLDNRLGGVDGVDLLPQVKGTWHCPVWILTGLTTDRLEAQAAASGAAGVIAKDQLLLDSDGRRWFLQQALESTVEA